MKKAIKDSDLKGFKWTADKNGLHWEYLDIVFRFSGRKEWDECVMYSFKDWQTGIGGRAWVVTGDMLKYLDDDFCADAETAIYKAAMKTIAIANRLY